MRLRRESAEAVTEGSLEYKTAVKSVIRCQIQALLEKLSAETGEESIVIVTNTAAGTYSHLGSELGQGYLEDGGQHVQVICNNFTDFCVEMQSQCFETRQSFNMRSTSAYDEPRKMRVTLPAPKSTPRKRPMTSPDMSGSPSTKRKHNSSDDCGTSSLSSLEISPVKGSNSSQNVGYLVMDNNSNQSSQKMKGGNCSQIVDSASSHKDEPEGCVPYIKIEPSDDFCDYPDGMDDAAEMDSDYTENGQSQKSITNRPKSLIPLANIFKRYGGNKATKQESPSKPETPENVGHDSQPSEKSILRSLYEQPIYGLSDYADSGDVETPKSDISQSANNQPAISLPSTFDDNLDSFAASSENLVLSGYYDSESYPTYRHKQKHTLNSTKKSMKTEKKLATVNLIDSPVSSRSNVDFHLRTFESGGRLVYACDVCKRELSHLTSYRRHMKLHTMERPHKCPVCSKGFIRKYHCIDHMNKHHKEIGFDPDTLLLTGINTEIDPQDQASSMDMENVSAGEYNYTLDTSLGVDSDQSGSVGGNHIDQTASSMLTELAKSVAKSNLEQSGNDRHFDSSIQSEDDNLDVIQSDNGSEAAQSESSEIIQLEKRSGENEVKEGIDGDAGESALARKKEVSQGIKAIVAHLKSSSKNKRKKTSPENNNGETYG